MTVVSLIDVLADLRPDVDADILLVCLCGGATHALTIREIVRGAAVGLRLERAADGSLRAALRSDLGWESNWAVASLRAVTFTEFVGAPQGGRGE
jgi:hypothetical protein